MSLKIKRKQLILIPNKTTSRAIKDVEKKKGFVKVKDAQDLFKKLGIK